MELKYNSPPVYSALPVCGDISLSECGYMLSKKFEDGKYINLSIRNQYLHTIYSLNFMHRQPIVLINHKCFQAIEFKPYNHFLKKMIRFNILTAIGEVGVLVRLPSISKTSCKIEFIDEGITYYWKPRSISKWYLTLENEERWLAKYQDDRKCQTFGKIDLFETLPEHHHGLLATIMALLRFKCY